MTVQIAVAGKGGTGKTTLSALLTRCIVEERPGKSVLGVDADANANFNEALGLEVEKTISSILEETKDPRKVPAGMTKELFVEHNLHMSLVESKNYDLVVMGNPHGPGCYCYPSDLLRKHLEKLRGNYDYVIVDNEAGLEHLSRRILSDIDYLVVTSDASARGIRSAGRVHDIVKSVNLVFKDIFLVVSRVQSPGDMEELRGEIEKTGLKLAGTVPLDPLVTQYDLKGIPLFQLPDDSGAYQAAKEIFRFMDL